MQDEQNTKNKGTARRIVFFCGLAAALLGVCLFGYIFFGDALLGWMNNKQPQVVSSAPVSSQTVLPANPIDFATLHQTNTDIYAWIRIPNTKIDYPVLQSTDTDDGFYLNHDIYRKYKFAGCIYSEKKNNTDFSDPNTVLYGHNMLNGSMFQNLHKFRKADFFNENQYIYMYTPGHILTYQIFAAYKYDDRHILNSFNFSDPAVFDEYLSFVRNPQSLLVNKRDVELNAQSKLLTLSTCIGNEESYRYLVQGVMIKDEQTQ